MKQKITLFIMGYKGYYTLSALVKAFGSDVFDKIIYATDKQVLNDYADEIVGICKSESITFFHRSDNFSVDTEYSIALSWRWLIKLDEEKKVIVCHDSLLPKYRGFAPLVNALINGDAKIGVTALFASEEYDRGDLISQKSIEIDYPIKIADAIKLLANLYCDVCIDLIKSINSSKSFLLTKQNETNATYSLWRDEDDYKINWNNDAVYIKRFIDSVGFPYRGASTFLNGIKVRILDSSCIRDVKISSRDVGKAIFFEGDLPIIVCGKGLLRITTAVYDKDQSNIFPLTKFRIKFTS